MAKLRLYLADIGQLDGREELALSLLTPERRKRAEAIRVENDRRHCIAAGLLLRRVLGVTSDEMLHTGEFGKPILSGGPHFNLTHGGSYAVLAVFHAPVGVDVEPIGERIPSVPRRFLLPDELAWLVSAPSPSRFAWLWTRLESALKADGRGFSMESRNFSVLDGENPHIETMELAEHFLSCAAGEPFETELTYLTAEELLK